MPKLMVALLVPLLLASACGDDDAVPRADATPAATPTATPPATPDVVATARVPLDIVDPGDAGQGVNRPIGGAPLPEGWSETELILGGEAVRHELLGEATADGTWDAVEDRASPYRTRMIVRRPPVAAFSGVVLVEWLNVTAGADNSPDWAYLAEEITRAGHAYVAVSAQAVGIDGVEGDFVGGGLVDTRGLRAIDPVRYGDLRHPGDAYSFDIFSQAGAAVAGVADLGVLGDLSPSHVIAMGESQSAGFLTTYVNAVHPLAQVYDGFLVHSRGSAGPSLGAERMVDGDGGPVRIRTDLDAPVLIYETETDLFTLGYVAARQDDTDTVRTWEVAGTAHADAYVLAVSGGLDRDAGLGASIGCATPINDGPQHETLQAALHHLVAWVMGGTPPPSAPRLETDENGIVRDTLGIASGGVRTPPVDAPLRVLSGDPGSDGGACFLFGQTLSLSPGELRTIYADQAAYVRSLEEAAAAAVEAGWLLPEDAATMIEEETARAATVGLG